MVKLILRKHNKNSYNIHNADYDGCIEHHYDLLAQHSQSYPTGPGLESKKGEEPTKRELIDPGTM